MFLAEEAFRHCALNEARLHRGAHIIRAGAQYDHMRAVLLQSGAVRQRLEQQGVGVGLRPENNVGFAAVREVLRVVGLVDVVAGCL